MVVMVGYLAVLAVSAVLVFARYRQYANNPADAIASGGMYAFGDWLLEIFIGFLFLIPTFVLAVVLRASEIGSTRYAKTLLGVSLTAPMSAAALLIPAVMEGNSVVGWLATYRLSAEPILVLWLTVSRWLTTFARAKRLISYALLIEVGSIALLIAVLFLLSNQ
jgi:hypothetical protein